MNHFLYWLTQNRRILDIDTYDRLYMTTRLPLWIALFLAVLAVVAAVYMYRRCKGIKPDQRRKLTILRAAGYVVLLLILVGPMLHIEGEGRPAGPMPVIVDRTGSMSIIDVADKPRLAVALKLADALTANASSGQGLNQVSYLYGDKVMPWDGKTDPSVTNRDTPKETTLPVVYEGAQTSVREMITDSLKPHGGVYVPGILLIGDGAHNAGELIDPAISLLKKRRIPAYFIPVGQERPKDVSLDQVMGEDIVFVGEKFKFFVSMHQWGYTGRNLPVSATFGSAKLTIPNIKPEADGEMTFPIEHIPADSGVFDLTVQIPPDNEEVTKENNKITRRIRVIKDRIRVLMVFGGPSWEFRFLNGAFMRDRRVDHKIYLESVDPRIFKQKQTRFLQNLPATRNELFRNYDMVIVSRIDMQTLPPEFLTILTAFVVDEGGGLVVLSDGNYIPYSFKGTSLETLLPVRFTEAAGASSFKQELFKPLDIPAYLKIAEEGYGSPIISFDADRKRNEEIWDAFPPIFEVCPDAELKPSAITLVEAAVKGESRKKPAIVYHTVGKGMTLYMGFDSTWRWRKECGDRYFRDYWGKVVQFMGLPHLLGESAQSSLFLDRLHADIADRVVVTASIRNKDYSPLIAESVPVTIKREDGKTVDMGLPAVAGRPGIFRASYYPDAEGKLVFSLPAQYRAESPEMDVTQVSREFRNSGADLALMRHIAGETKGEVFTQLPKDMKSIDQFAKSVLSVISKKRSSTTIIEEETLWDTASLMIIALLLFGIEYLFRKRWYLD